jgi:hypothetical protein
MGSTAAERLLALAIASAAQTAYISSVYFVNVHFVATLGFARLLIEAQPRGVKCLASDEWPPERCLDAAIANYTLSLFLQVTHYADEILLAPCQSLGWTPRLPERLARIGSRLLWLARLRVRSGRIGARGRLHNVFPQMQSPDVTHLPSRTVERRRWVCVDCLARVNQWDTARALFGFTLVRAGTRRAALPAIPTLVDPISVDEWLGTRAVGAGAKRAAGIAAVQRAALAHQLYARTVYAFCCFTARASGRVIRWDGRYNLRHGFTGGGGWR